MRRSKSADPRISSLQSEAWWMKAKPSAIAALVAA